MVEQAKTARATRAETWGIVNAQMQSAIPQVFSVLGDEDSFISLLVKLQPDGSFLSVLKRYGPDGGPMVCFGSGYGYLGCLFGLEGTVAAGKWRVDEPYQR